MSETTGQEATKGASLRRSVLSYTSAAIFCRVAAIVQNLLVIRWMEPEALGVWLGLQLITIYGTHAHFGVLAAVNQQVPHHLGRDENDQADRIEDLARGWFLILGVGGISAAALMALGGLGTSDYGRGAIALTLAATITLAVNLHLGIFRARNRFGRAGLANVISALAMLAGLPLVYTMQYDGLLWRVVAVSVVTLLACLAMNGWNLRFAFDRSELWSLIKLGAPIVVVVGCAAVFAAMDRTLILWLLDEHAMGQYALCFAVARVMKLFPTTFGQVFYPRMTAIYATEGMSRALFRRCAQASLLSGAVVAVIAVGAVLTLPWVVQQLFPKYVDGLPALNIAMIAYVVLALAAGPMYFLISTLQKRRQLAVVIVAGVAMVAIAGFVVERTIEGIAWSLVAGSAVYSGGLWAAVLLSGRRRANA